MTKAIETLTGADLDTFREAMLRAGMECLLGKAAIDGNVAGDTPITINATQGYLITKVLVAGFTPEPPNYAVVYNLYDHAGGGAGALISLGGSNGPNSLGYSVTYEDIAGNSYKLDPGGVSQVFSAATLYLRVSTREGAPLAFTVYVYGIYADPA